MIAPPLMIFAFRIAAFFGVTVDEIIENPYREKWIILPTTLTWDTLLLRPDENKNQTLTLFHTTFAFGEKLTGSLRPQTPS